MSSTPPVNSYQVGGAHYARGGSAQHWDWVESNGMGYLEACASKYVTRWRHKNGVQDLQKAVHYVAKLRSLAVPRVCLLGVFSFYVAGRANRAHNRGVTIEQYAEANDLQAQERYICGQLQHWKTEDDLEYIQYLIEGLIARASAFPPGKFQEL